MSLIACNAVSAKCFESPNTGFNSGLTVFNKDNTTGILELNVLVCCIFIVLLAIQMQLYLLKRRLNEMTLQLHNNAYATWILRREVRQVALFIAQQAGIKVTKYKEIKNDLDAYSNV